VSVYHDDPELDALHQHWLTAQARMMEAHELAREFESRLAGDESVPAEELVGGADLAARARDATEIWLQIDERLTQARAQRWESHSLDRPPTGG